MGGCGQSSHWRIPKISFPPLRLYGVCGAKICLKTTDPGLASILTAQNYCNFSKLPTFYPLICIVFIPKACLTPPQSWSASTPWSCLSASLVMVITRFWWWKLPPSCRLILVSSVLFCPLLPYSLSSVSLRDFFGVAHLITIAGQATSSYRNVFLLFFLVMAKLERAQFYAWLIESVVIRCTYCFCCFPYSAGCIETTQTPLTLFFSDEPFFHFSCDRFLIVYPWFFFSTCVFVKKIPSNRGEALILM